MNGYKLLAPCLTLLFLGCWHSGKISEFDLRLDAQIQTNVAKRTQMVQGNPLYLSLVTDLKKGRDFLLNGHPTEAYKIFDSIMANSRLVNFPEYSYAKYYLACAMYEMGIDYGALLYFVDIVRKEPLKPHTHESLRRAIQIAQKLKDDELVLYLAGSIEQDKVPKSLREEFRYFIAKELYHRREYRKANELLNSISHTNRLYLAAKYLTGAMYVEQNDFKSAIRVFQEISNHRSRIKYYENEKIRELANLGLGRLFYESQNYPLSIVYYKKLDRLGDDFPQALYESSWALFKLNKFNEALSVLQTLNSPFFDQVYFLKSYLLRGAIDLELCDYEMAVKTLSELEDRFGGLKGQIDRFAIYAKNPRQYYPVLSSKKIDSKGNSVFAYDDLFKLSAANRDFLGVHRYILRLKKEKELLKSVESPRSALLAQLLTQKQTQLTEKASYMVGKKLLYTRQLIEDFQGLKEIIRYEIVSSERKVLQKRALGLAPPVIPGQDLIRPEFTESLKESMMWWDWNGEYWQDELGFYLVDRKSRCKDKETELKK